MPGLYINDPELGSSLGNILGGIATNMDPKTQAEAQELRQRVMQEDLNNQILRGRIAGATGIPGVLAAGNADPTAGQGGVAGTLAGAAVPPATGPAPGTFGGSTVNAGFDPYAKVLSGSYLNDPSMGNFSTGINLGKDMTTGPGTDFPTANAIAQAKAVPYNTVPGETRHVPGGALPESTVSGGSTYNPTATTAAATSDDAVAARDLDLGARAKADLGRLNAIDSLYDALDASGSNDMTEIAKDLAVQKASEMAGVDLSRFRTVDAAKAAIRSLAVGLTGTIITTQGNPLPKGALSSIENLSPDPNAPAAQFHILTGAIRALEQGQAANFDAALEYRKNIQTPGVDAGGIYHIKRGQNATAEAAAHARLGVQPDNAAPAAAPTAAPAAPTSATPEANPPKLRAANPQELIYARNALANALKNPQGLTPEQIKQQIIDHGKSRATDPFDLSLSGF